MQTSYTIDDIPSDILLKIFSSVKCEYPWKSLHFIFNNIKMTWNKWRIIVESSEKVICDYLEISPLHFASAMNREDEIVRLFLEENCILRMSDKNGYSAACYATGSRAYRAMRRLKVARALDSYIMSKEKLKSFALPNDPVVNTILDSDELFTQKNFKNAIEKQSINDMEEILISGINSISCHIMYSEIFKYHIELIKWKLVKDNSINRLLIYYYKNHLICNFWNTMAEKTLKLCLENDINCNTCDEKGHTFLHKSVMDVKYINITKILLDCKNINVGARISPSSRTPLSYAIQKGNTEAVKIIINYLSINRVTKNTDYIFELSYIFITDRDDYLNLLIDHDLKINIDHMGIALITHYPTKMRPNGSINPIKCMEVILKYININTYTNYGYIPIWIPIVLGNIDNVNFLIHNGADSNVKTNIKSLINIYDYLNRAKENTNMYINAQIKYIDKCNDTYTPLQYASLFGNLDIVKLLLENKADKTLCTESGLTALDLARNAGYMDIVDILT
jgi:ankyrin repeat protein